MNPNLHYPINNSFRCYMCNNTRYINEPFSIKKPCRCLSIMNCNMCLGTGFFENIKGFQQPCQCGISPRTIIYTHKHHRNLFEKVGNKFKAIFSCSRCHGNGWVYSKYGNQTYCPTCITVNKYCPKCNNTRYKLKNGKNCVHYF